MQEKNFPILKKKTISKPKTKPVKQIQKQINAYCPETHCGNIFTVIFAEMASELDTRKCHSFGFLGCINWTNPCYTPKNTVLVLVIS